MQVNRVKGMYNSARSKLPGREHEMTYNDAGGAVFIDDAKRLERFIILGIDEGTIYATPEEIHERTIELIRELPYETFKRVMIEAAPKAWRKRNPIAAIAIRAALTDDRALIFNDLLPNLPGLFKTPSDLLYFASMYRGAFRKPFSRSVRRFVQRKLHDFDDYQLAKYRKRYGISTSDLLKLAHPHPGDRNAVFHYLLDGEYTDELAGTIFEGLKLANIAGTVDEVLKVAERFNLSWEMLPSWALKDADTWVGLYRMGKIPAMALLRNAWRFDRDGVPGDVFDSVVEDLSKIHRRGVHPGYILTAAIELKRRNASYDLVDALFKAFDAASSSNAAHDMRIGLAIDNSGSMWWGMIGGMLRLEAALALGSVIDSAFRRVSVTYFSNRAYNLNIRPRSALDSFEDTLREYSGGTSVASALSHLADRRGDGYDATVVITDEQNWAGESVQMTYQRHKKTLGKLIIVTVDASAKGSLTDPKDPDQVTVVGLVPEIDKVIAEFVRG